MCIYMNEGHLCHAWKQSSIQVVLCHFGVSHIHNHQAVVCVCVCVRSHSFRLRVIYHKRLRPNLNGGHSRQTWKQLSIQVILCLFGFSHIQNNQAVVCVRSLSIRLRLHITSDCAPRFRSDAFLFRLSACIHDTRIRLSSLDVPLACASSTLYISQHIPDTFVATWRKATVTEWSFPSRWS